MKFKNKNELIDFIEHQTNIKLTNDKNNILNKKRKILHTEITKQSQNVLRLLKKYNIQYEHHIGNDYFIYV